MGQDILDVCEELIFGANGEVRIDFIGKGSIWLQNTYKNDTIVFARHMINEALQKTAPGQLSVIGLDSGFSGIFAPFASLASGAGKSLEILGGLKDLEDCFERLWQHIQAVQNVIQGRSPTLTAFRRAIGRPVEGYMLVVLSMNLSEAERTFLANLSTLLGRGPAAGVSFLILPFNNLITGDRKPEDVIRKSNCAFLSADDNKAVLLDNNGMPRSFALFTPPDVTGIIRNCEGYTQSAGSATLPVVRFDEVNDLSSMWDLTSENGLTFTVGKYGVNDVEITIGDEINQRHNALITGAVGQGKSNLISVIIHSLCQRYSPRELSLYLLDFKEGVSLKPFAGAGGREFLPHAKVVGLESDVELGLAVLEHLYGEYLHRMKLFKERDVKNLKEFRSAFPKEEMPRIVAIIDEFQLMFGDEQSFGQKTVDLLEKSVRLFRAAGIHFILASQSISGSLVLANKRESIFSQVPIRIAHKNSVSESQSTLGMSNTAAAYLRPREAIVNLDYGEISQNHKTVIAWADEEVLRPLRKSWREKMSPETLPPYVFESDRRISAASAPADAVKLKPSAAPVALLGERISVTGEKLAVRFPNESGRNIAIIGSPDAELSNGEGIIHGVALSVAAVHKGECRFLMCDFRDRDDATNARSQAFARAMAAQGAPVEDIPPGSFKEALDGLLAGASAGQARKTFVFALGLDRWAHETERYADPPLKDFVGAAPEKGIHFVGWWIKQSKFLAQASGGYGGTDAFNTKIFLHLDENSVRSLTNPFVKWKAAFNRALLSDEVEYAEETVFIPYSPVN